MVMKGLPLTYAKDMQEDKETTFDALRSFAVAVAAMRGMIEDLEPDPTPCALLPGWIRDCHGSRRLAGARAEAAVS